jgi:hypothetical protein
MKATMAAHARRRFDALCKAAVMRRMPLGFGSSQLFMDNRRLVSNEAAAQAARLYLHRCRSACSYRWQTHASKRHSGFHLMMTRASVSQ